MLLTGAASFSFSLNQSSSISSYVTLRRAASASGVTVRLNSFNNSTGSPQISGLSRTFVPPLPPGATKERPGAPVLRGHGAEAAGEDERRRAAREDEEAPEGSRPPTQAHPEPRRPPSLSVSARPVLPAPALSRFGISMFRTLSRMT